MLFAGGGVLIAGFVERRSRWLLQGVIAGAVLVGGVLFAPIALPVLPPGTQAQYAERLSPPRVEQGATARLPQWFADRFGWEEMAASVAEVLRSLPEQEPGQVLLLAENYGEAGALELFGPRYGLPPVLSPHNTCHLWSAEHDEAQTYIAIGLPEEELRRVFGEVTAAGVHRCTWCMDYENDLTIYVCRNARTSFRDWWPAMKWYGGARKS
jgi:hypothetical protein